MAEFSFWDILLLLGIAQGFLLSLAISRIKNQSGNANKVLTSIIYLASLMLLGKVFQPRFNGDWLIRASVFADTTIYIFGPLIFIYVKNLVSPKNNYKLTFWHWLPAIFHLVYFGWSLFIDVPTFLVIMFQKIPLALFIIEATGLVSLLSYWIASIYLVKKNINILSFYSPSQVISVKQYLLCFLSVVGLLCYFG